MNKPLVFKPYQPSSLDSVTRDILPHRSREGRTVFLTWRLSDSLPDAVDLEKSVRRAQRRWLRQEGLSLCPWTQDVDKILLENYYGKYTRYRLVRFWVQERFDRKKCGKCALANRSAVEAVRTAIKEEAKFGVEIGDGVICYNHVHVLVMMTDEVHVERSAQRIKGRASRYLGQAQISDLPKPIWQRYAFDHVVRNRMKLDRIRTYISDHRVPCRHAKFSVEWLDA